MSPPSSPTKRSLSQSDLPKRQSPKKKNKRDVRSAFYLYSDSELSDEVSDDEMDWSNDHQAPRLPHVEPWVIDRDDSTSDNEPSKFNELPSSVLARIASYLMDASLKDIEECRACGCLGPVSKPCPYRCGTTCFSKDPFTESDIRCDPDACPLTKRGGFGGGWCLKQYVARQPGKKRQVPSFAVASKDMWRKWRDATVWVFCCEACMHNLIPGLPKYNSRLITRARFYERNNDMHIDGLSREGYAMNTYGGYDDWLVYETNGNKLVEYRGQKMWAKELVLSDL